MTSRTYSHRTVSDHT